VQNDIAYAQIKRFFTCTLVIQHKQVC
jgi:hypothetical protein